VWVIVCAVVHVSCTPKTDEEQIQELMKQASQHIENKEISNLMDLLSNDYTDFRGRDKNQTKDMVQTYFREFRGIVVHLLSTQIDGIDLDKASIRSDAAISSGAVQALRKLVPVSTDNYRFQIELIKTQDRWMIHYAEWRHIGIEELFPESLSILKKLFSNK
jgi:hypothetical protein